MSGELVEIRIEDPGNTVEVEVIEVMVQPGAQVTAGTVLLEVATDKANAEIDAPADGVVEEVHVAEGDIIPVDRVLAVLRK
jgi:pyruvate/2-oxoglutarate dehydrogenase complex dihydrolipoamide acyltransferase (E2) component